MQTLGIVCATTLAGAVALAGEINGVPSGQALQFVERVVPEETAQEVVHFRFLAPAIARDTGNIGPEAAQDDMKYLCERFALPMLADEGMAPERIIISLADRALAFGEPDPEATQYIEVYRPEAGACIWEFF